MKLYNLSLLLNAIGQFISAILLAIVGCVFVVVMVGLFLLMLVFMFIAWAFGMPIKVTTPGMFPGTKYTRHYRWFTVIRK
jgi:hypothetical protein